MDSLEVQKMTDYQGPIRRLSNCHTFTQTIPMKSEEYQA